MLNLLHRLGELQGMHKYVKNFACSEYESFKKGQSFRILTIFFNRKVPLVLAAPLV